MGRKNKEIKLINWRQVTGCVLVCSLFILLLTVNYRSMYNITMENVYRNCQNNYLSVAGDIKDYLRIADTAVEILARRVEDMQANGASSETIREFLVDETGRLDKDIMQHSTGFYGYVDGVYVDGIGWVPDEGYDATTRPWYTEAVKVGNVIVYVSPYMDSMTGELMVTIARKLRDGMSVVALDLQVTKIQEGISSITASSEIAAETGSFFGQSAKTPYEYVELFIVDKTGMVIVHSNKAEQGKNYLEGDDSVYKEVVTRGITKGEDMIRIDDENLVFNVGKISEGWYLFSGLHVDEVFSRSMKLLRISMIVGIFGVLGIIAIMISMAFERFKAEKNSHNLLSAAGIYLVMVNINLPQDSYETISCKSERLKAIIGDKGTDARKTMEEIIRTITDERSVSDMRIFMNLDTLYERMNDVNTLSHEYMDISDRWCRVRFIASDRDNKGKLIHVLIVSEIIDREKRDRDRLLYLSETDQMTGVNNRGTGEMRIRKQLMEGECGMLAILDIDRFKQINDTYGHGVGDKVLVMIATAMKATFREKDITMRLGGDEFAVYVNGVNDRNEAEFILKRFIGNVEKRSVEELQGNPVNVSIGVAFYRKGDRFAFEELYRRADACTYESKKKEGNSISFFEE